MKVLKIKIQKELVDIPDNKIYFERTINAGGTNELFSEGVAPESAPRCDSIKEYAVMRVISKEFGEHNLLVPVNDQGLFNELLEVSNSTLQQALKSAENRGTKFGYLRALLDVKELPWYKRLLI